jgi:dihydrolipoamide dehydrogenase
LIEAANAYHGRKSFDAFGIRGGQDLQVDVPAVLRRVRRLRDGFVAGALRMTDSLGARSVAGRARLLGPDTVEVEGRELRARRIVLATGSRPVVPGKWRALGARLLTTDELFEQEGLPGRMAVVGLGAVGVEMAQALSRLGVDVVGFGSGKTLAGLSDEAVDEALLELLRQELALHKGAPVELSEHAAGVEITSGETRTVVDRVLVAVGRRPNVDGLGLESLGVALDERGLPPVDPGTLQIADLPVFLAGDANGRRAILHEAADEGHVAGINACSDDLTCFRRRTPLNIVFSDPNVAVVGRRLADLAQDRVVIGSFDFERQARARTGERNKGMARIYADAQSGRLLGSELCAPSGEHLAHLLALAIDSELTVQDLLGLPFYHPVLEEGLRSALRELAAELPEGSASDLATCSGFRVEALD